MKKIDLKNFKAVILAGGMGTRLYPITYEIPKPLLPVKGKPIINYLIDLFSKYNIEKIAILINQKFKNEFFWWKKRYYLKRNFVFVEERKPLGTMGGLFYLKKWIKNSPFFLTNGDELKKINLKEMAKFHLEKKVLATIALIRVENPRDYGVVICEDGLVKKFVEKPKRPSSNFINAGIYLFSPEIFNFHPGPKFSKIEIDLFPRLAKEKKLAGFKFNGKWMDCGTWERYERALMKWIG